MSGNSQRIPNVPYLPGNTFVDPTVNNFRKSHVFDYRGPMRTVNDEAPAVGGVPKPYAPPNPRLTSTAQSLVMTMTKPRSADDEVAALPSWVAFDRKVLRFDGFFKEPVHESNTENYRVRKCVIYYYLEDDSIHVAEPKRENSGIPQGMFLKRHRIPKANGEFYTLMDLNVGVEVSFYGRNYRIFDCDKFTKNFYEKLGIEVGEPEECPVDTYHELRHTITAKLRGPAGGPPKPKDDDLTRFMEAKLGLATNILQEDTLAQFLQNDRKVLRFYCVWDDRDNLYGEKRPFVLHYYLADDTVEILEVNKPNTGRDPFPVFLRRQRLPKSPQSSFVNHETGEGEFSIPGQSKMQTSFFTDRDLRVGKRIRVYNRDFYLYACDKFTREHFQKAYGIRLESNVDVREEEAAPPTMDRPPYNGFGSEEDSLGSFIYLVPKVPKKDFVKFMGNDRKILRFTARMITTAPEDVGRRFIISYYLADDTVSVYEPPIKNSGIIGGKFLERSRMKRPVRQDFYEAKDFFVGAELEFHCHKFLLMEADDYTLQFMEMHSREFPSSDPSGWRPRMNQAFSGVKERLTDEFRSYDMDGDNLLNKAELRQFFASRNVHFSEQELASILFRYDLDGDGMLSVEEFTAAAKDS